MKSLHGMDMYSHLLNGVITSVPQTGIIRIRRSPMICSVRPKSRMLIQSQLMRKRRDGISETTNLYAACIPVYRRMQQPANGARGTAAGTGKD